jgi:hypothetical protein
MSELLASAHTDTPAPPSLAESVAAGLVPVDEYGMPYLIYPFDAPDHLRGRMRRWDDDHSFFFSDLPELNDQAGRALRYSRVQHTPRWLHDRKHNEFFPNGLAWLPNEEGDKFALTVLACGGYASRLALDLRGNEPRLIRMSGSVYDFVRGKKQLHFETRRKSHEPHRTPGYAQRKIGSFFADYIRRQQIDDIIDERTIDQFLHTPNNEVRARLGNLIIEQAITAAAEPIEPTYREAAQKGLVRPRVQRAAEAISLVFPRDRWVDYHDALEHGLAA